MVKSAMCMAMVLTCYGSVCLAQSSPNAGSGTPALSPPGYTITLTQPASSFSLGSEIKIPMTITNITGGDVFWQAVWSTDKESWYRGFRFLLTKDGKEVETTFFHRKISGRQRQGDPNEVESGSTVVLPKPPGIMFVITIDLKRLYDISEPGKYTLEVTRFAGDNKTVVHSNAVTLNIVR